ncbi:MAG: ScpA family protein [Clostridia bacterium]|nr:ScpA family protein [Clostridia bacterium]
MKVETSVFTGPLDLLLSLIERKQIDVCEVSISEIADDYLSEITAMEWPDIDQISEFLVIAATLLYIKVRALLPPDEAAVLSVEGEEDASGVSDPRAELVARLIEYRRYRDAARSMRALEERGACMFARTRQPAAKSSPRGNPLVGLTVQDLARLYLDAAAALPEEFTLVPSDEIPIASQMVALLSRLASRGQLGFLEFLGGGSSRTRLVATLLALLELVRRGRVSAAQSKPFGEIWVFPRASETNGGGQHDSHGSAGGN